MINSLATEFDFYVLASAYDLSENDILPGIETDKWTERTGCKVYYASKISLKKIQEIVKEVNPDTVYLNSMFSFGYTILPLITFLFRKNFKIVLCPRGMLRSSALDFKQGKKKFFLHAAKKIGLFSKVTFHATDHQEKLDVQKWFPDSPVVEVSNFSVERNQNYSLEKIKGDVKLLTIGRIHPIKGIDVLLKSLQLVSGNVELSIIGKIEDRVYWDSCKEIINSLSPSLKVIYAGEQQYHLIEHFYNSHHVFVSPTKGENFGHSIVDSFMHGRPVIISDQTPWRNLDSVNAGFDIQNEVSLFAEKIQTVINWTQEEFDTYSNGAKQMGRQILNKEQLINQYKILLT
jgi:glycosyltransferase involved in cell wall biosynthesis